MKRKTQFRLREAAALIEEGSFEEAEHVCRLVLRNEPRNRSAKIMLGQALLGLGEFEEASFVLTLLSMLREDEDDPLVLGPLAAARCALGQYDATLTVLDRLPQAARDGVSALNCRGIALNGLGRHAEALDVLGRALTAEPGHVGSRHARAMALHGLGRDAEARDALEAVLREQPNRPLAWGDLGRVLLALRLWAESAAASARSLALLPDQPEIATNRDAARAAMAGGSAPAQTALDTSATPQEQP